MIVQEKRGMAMASFAIGPMLGPVVGPVVGGFITIGLGWRWVFWIMAIISGTFSLLFLAFSRESYAAVLIGRKTTRLQKETGNPLLRSKLDKGLSNAAYIKRSIQRPFKLLIMSPISIICGIYVGIAYAYLYLMFTSLTPLFMEIYHFKTSYAGLAFLGLGVGSMIGVVSFSVTSDRNIKKKAAEEAVLAEAEGRAPEGMKPEYRLSPLPAGAIILPIGFFIYGWTAEYQVHWIAPIIGTVVIGIGDLIVFMVRYLYFHQRSQAKAFRRTDLVPILVPANVPRRHLSRLCCLGSRSERSRPFHPWICPPSRRLANVQSPWHGLGQQYPWLHRPGADTSSVALPSAWRGAAEEV
jgi:MFS family permease